MWNSFFFFLVVEFLIFLLFIIDVNRSLISQLFYCCILTVQSSYFIKFWTKFGWLLRWCKNARPAPSLVCFLVHLSN